MKFGAFGIMTESTSPPSDFAPALEQAGFESFWTGEHSHVSNASVKSWDGRPTPEYRKRMLDPFLGLTAVAAATTRLRVGTCICLVPQRHTIQLAKEVATIDVLSGGRFLFGVGAGWDDNELANHGVEPADRHEIFSQRLDAMAEIWTNEVAEFHGSLIDFPPLRAWPKPVQKPYPPIYLGGEGPTILKRVVRRGAGWMPNWVDGAGRYQIERIPELRRLEEEAGDPAPVTIFSGPADPRGVAHLSDPVEIERAIEAGVERLILALPIAGSDQVLPEIERLGGAIEAYV